MAVWAVLRVAPVFFGQSALLPERDKPLRDQDCAARILTMRDFFLSFSFFLLERWHVLYTAAPWMWRCGANQISQRSHQLYCQPGKRIFITLTPPCPLSCHSVTHPPGQLCCVTSDFDFMKLFFCLFCFVFLGSSSSECQLFFVFPQRGKKKHNI